jgi:primosomal replication protein N
MAQSTLFPQPTHRNQSPNMPSARRAAQPTHLSEPARENNYPATGRHTQPGFTQQSTRQFAPSPMTSLSATQGQAKAEENGQVRLFGWIGRYFEVKPTQSGVLRASFSIATPMTFRDSTGTAAKKTVWQRIVAWGPAAEAVQQQLRQGARVHIEGRFKTREWTDRDNNLRTTTELVARNVRFLDLAA